MAAANLVGETIMPPPTQAELQEQVNAALLPIASALPNTAQYTVTAINEGNLTVKEFCNAIKSLASYQTQGVLGRLIGTGVSKAILPGFTDIMPGDLYKFAQWLKGKHGRDEIANVTTTRKLEKRARVGRSATEMAWVQLFQTMQADCSQEIKKKKLKFEKKKVAARKVIDDLEAEEAAQCALILSRYPGVDAFEPMPKLELFDECWKLYLADCVVKGIIPRPKLDHHMVAVVNEFGPVVRDAHMESFCQRPEVKAAISEYSVKRISGIGADVGSAQKETFRRLLAAATGEQVNVTATPAQTRAPEEGPSRAPVIPRPAPELDTAYDNLYGREADKETSDGDSSSTSFASQGGTKYATRAQARLQRQDQGR